MSDVRYVYRITNTLNGKTYIGQHKFNNKRYKDPLGDLYWGGGKLIRLAEEKYGIENFKKEIIIIGNYTGEEIDKFEKCMIFFEKLIGKAEYNISKGGRDHLGMNVYNKKERSEKMKKAFLKKKEKDPEAYKQFVNSMSTHLKNRKGFQGRLHNEETKRKMSEIARSQNRSGSNNGSFGKHWFTNGQENIKCENCPKGFRPGRIIINIAPDIAG